MFKTRWKSSTVICKWCLYLHELCIVQTRSTFWFEKLFDAEKRGKSFQKRNEHDSKLTKREWLYTSYSTTNVHVFGRKKFQWRRTKHCFEYKNCCKNQMKGTEGKRLENVEYDTDSGFCGTLVCWRFSPFSGWTHAIGSHVAPIPGIVA